MVFALVDIYGAWRATAPGQRSWRAARAALAIATAAILIVIPSVAFAIVIFLGAIAWMVIGAITLAAALDPTIGSGPAGRRPTGLSDLVVTWLRSRDVGADRRVEIIDSYSYETDVRGKLSRFAILLGLSSAIAAAGLLGNSVAAIIGAMIVAPLMGPIIGIAIGIVTGSSARAWRSLQVVVAGIATTVLIGVALGAWLGGPTVTENSEIVGRTAPTLLDLVVALSAGAAGRMRSPTARSRTRCRGWRSRSPWSRRWRRSASCWPTGTSRRPPAPACSSSPISCRSSSRRRSSSS